MHTSVRGSQSTAYLRKARMWTMCNTQAHLANIDEKNIDI